MLDMAIEIAHGEGVNLVRSNRDWLLAVRRGEVSYDEIMSIIVKKDTEMKDAFDKCSLPDKVDMNFAHNIILQIRG
jgi:hypothetical protein